MIHGLSRQLGGELTVTGTDGACFALTLDLGKA